MRPIFHLSLPVRDLAESIAFYTSGLDAEIGRRNDAFVDVLLFGAQITLHNDPTTVSDPMPRSRHFGATVSWTEWESVAARLGGSETVVEQPTVSFAGEAIEQGKLMVADPSGNLIEVKAYRHPDQVLGPLVS
jgi:uncharacterized protein